jgi:hypothetical protein
MRHQGASGGWHREGQGERCLQRPSRKGFRDSEAAPLLKRPLTHPAHCHINAGTNGAHGA